MTAKREKIKKKKHSYVWLSVLSVVLFFFIWWLFTEGSLGTIKENVLPGPIKVFSTLIDKFSNKNPDGATMQVHLWASLKVTLSGYVIGCLVGIPLGILMGWYEKADIFYQSDFRFYPSDSRYCLDSAFYSAFWNRYAAQGYCNCTGNVWAGAGERLYGNTPDERSAYLGWPDVRGFQRRNFEKDCHSFFHPLCADWNARWPGSCLVHYHRCGNAGSNSGIGISDQSLPRYLPAGYYHRIYDLRRCDRSGSGLGIDLC